VDHGDWLGAQAEMLNSKWARQTPARAQRMAAAMRGGDAGVFDLPAEPPGV